MHQVEMLGDGLYLVTEDSTVEADHGKALKEFMRLRFGGTYDERAVLPFLQHYASAIPMASRLVAVDALVESGILAYGADTSRSLHSHTERSEALGIYGMEFDSVPGEGQCDGEAARFARPRHAGKLIVSNDRLAEYQDSLAYLARLGFAHSHDVDLDQNAMGRRRGEAKGQEEESEKGWYPPAMPTAWSGAKRRKAKSESAICRLDAGTIASGNEVDGYVIRYEFIGMPAILVKALGGTRHSVGYGDPIRRGHEVEGFGRAEVVMYDCFKPESQAVYLDLSLSPHDANWEYKGDFVLLRRMAAVAMLEILTPRGGIALRYDAYTGNITSGMPSSMAYALVSLSNQGKVHPCAWCGNPVINERYCSKNYRCRQDDNDAAKREVERGLDVETVKKNHPGIKEATIENLY